MQDTYAAAFVAAASQVLLALFGVDYYAMLWAFVGSLVALSQTRRKGRLQAVLYVLLSTFIGAVLGTAFVAFTESQHRAYLLLGSLLGGSGAQLILSALLQGVLNRIKLTLGGANDSAQSSR